MTAAFEATVRSVPTGARGMQAGPLAAFRVLTVPGLHGSGSGHWQTRWEQLYPEFERVEQACWGIPELDTWSAQLDRALRQSTRPALLVAHSFGCITAVHRISAGAKNVAGALLVAPADPHKFRVADVLNNEVLTCPSIVVGSTNDPWMASQHAAEWTNRWGSDFVNLGRLGLGDWPGGYSLLLSLAGKASAAFRRT